MPTTPRKPAKAGSQAIVRTSGTIGTPAIARMLATAGTLSTTGTQATAMKQATTVKPTATEMPETVQTPTPREFAENAKNSQERRKFVKNFKVKIALFCPLDFSLSNSYRTTESPMSLVR
jgi:hypothetical protein